MRHFMLDIETLGVGTDAVVVSFAVVEFNPLSTVKTSSFYRVLNLQQQVNKGRKLDMGTLEFWIEHASAWPAKDQARVHVTDALMELDGFIDSPLREDTKAGLKPDYRLWAKPPSFDVAIMESLYASFGKRHPWGFRAPRDVRTAGDFLEQYELEACTNPGTLHNAVDDCYAQIKIVQRAFGKINNG